MNRYLLFVFLFGGVLHLQGQSLLTPNLQRIDRWQAYIDSLDGKRDGIVEMSVPQQTQAATTLYLTRIDQIERSILASDKGILLQKQLLWELGTWLQGIDSKNYHLFTVYQPRIDLIRKTLTERNDARLREQLCSNLPAALEIIPFFAIRNVALDVLNTAAQREPSLLLKHFSAFDHLRFTPDVLDNVARHAPLTLAYYLGSDNPVSRSVQMAASKPNIANLIRVQKQAGSGSKAYILMDDIIHNGMSLSRAESITRNRDSLFSYLIHLRSRTQILASYNVRDELRYLALLKVRTLNDLHEAPDSKRFESIRRPEMNAAALYFTMVYGEAEMYTSSFLGIYKVFLERLDTMTPMQFFTSVGLEGYPTFLRLCAMYNTIGTFLSRSPEWEIDLIFRSLCTEIRLSGEPLQRAVDLVDIYGELDHEQYRDILKRSLAEESRLSLADPTRSMLFMQIGQLLGTIPATPEVDTLKAHFEGIDPDLLFQKGEHVQQHFFYDDTDGRLSFYSFMSVFPSSHWRRRDFANYVMLESLHGRKVKIYANRPDKEIVGQKELAGIFSTTGHYPDVVVHRGHSYYVDATIEYLTPATQLVLLGSCGGYTQVSNVLNLSPDAQLITTKQVGMRVINNAMVLKLAEQMRTGSYSSWNEFWPQLSAQFASKPEIRENFKEYIKPGDNLSVLLIRMYRQAVMR